MAYVGICGYRKDDKNREYPCFLGLGKSGEFTWWGYSLWDIEQHSKVLAGEAEKPSYEKDEIVERITLDNLWVEIQPQFDPESEGTRWFADDLRTRVEAVWPDYNAYVTTYPEKTMSKYYHYTDGNIPQNLEDAYLVLSDKLSKVDTRRELFAWPW